MRRKNLDNMFNLIDDDILEEANPKKPKKSGLSKFGWAQIIVGAACLILTLNMAVLIPVFLSKDNNVSSDTETNVIENNTESITQKPDSNTDSEINTPTDSDTEVETPTDTESGTEAPTDTETEVGKPNDTETDTKTEIEIPIDTDTEIETPTETDTGVESEPPRDTESDIEFEDTEIETETETETETEIPTDTETDVETDTETETETDTGKVERPHAITIEIPGKGTHVIPLSSPLIGAPSEYDKIVESMQAIAGGSLGGGLVDKNESSEDLKEELEDALDKDDQEAKEEYKETTDNQIGGIIEGDIMKRSNEYIYYLNGGKLRVYRINEAATTLTSQFDFSSYIDLVSESLNVKIEEYGDEIEDVLKEEILDKWEQLDSSVVKEMFLSIDCKTLTIIVEHEARCEYINDILNGGERIRYLGDDFLYFTSLLTLNVEDPSNIYLSDVTTLSGSYESARLKDGEFLVFTRFVPKVKEFTIPQYNDGEGFKYIPAHKIYSPSEYKSKVYLAAYRVDAETNDVLEASAFASFDGEIFVTNESIYVTRQYRGKEKLNIVNYPLYSKNDENGIGEIIGYGTKYDVYSLIKTDILRIDLSSGLFETVGVSTVNGYIKDRYSFGENGEYLYVVTTDERVFVSTVYEEGEIGKEEDWIGYRNTTSANVFIVNKDTMQRVNQIERFAPVGETVRSVRFDGATAYVCTAVQIIDPVFFIDLSDPQNITYSNTGTIPGFSTQLIELPSGELLGIGTDGSGHVKIEVYRKGENNEVVIFDKILIEASSYSTNYKSHFIDRERGLIGLGINDNSQADSQRYVLVEYKNGSFTLLFNITLRGTNSTKRAFYDQETGYFYMLSNSDFTVRYIKKK